MVGHKLLFFFFFGAVGSLMPYVNLYFKRLGFTGTEIGILSAMQPVALMIGPPLAIALAVRYGLSRSILPIVATASLIPAALLIGVKGFWPLLFVYFAFMLLQAPISPFLDDSTLRRIEQVGGEYGRVRLWGSIGFIITANLIGPLSERWGIETTLYGNIVTLAALAGCTYYLMRSGGLPPISARSRHASFMSSLVDGIRLVGRLPGAGWLFVAGVLARFSQVGGLNFFAIHADDVGMPESMIGLSWGIAAGSEVILMAFSGWFLKRMGARGLFILGLVSGTVRWAIYAATSSVWTLLASQVLNAFTFAAYHIGAVTLIHHLFPEDRRTEGQSAWTVLTSGLPALIGSYLGGYLYDVAGLRPLFWISSAVALVAAVIALKIPVDRPQGESESSPLAS